MILDSDIKKLFKYLHDRNSAQIRLMGSDIWVAIDQNSVISLVTEVYFGGNFIPKSVRSSIITKPYFDRETIPTSLSIDEEHFKIFLKYHDKIEHLNQRTLIDVLEEFSYLADEWKLYLDEHDKNDLVYTRVK